MQILKEIVDQEVKLPFVGHKDYLQSIEGAVDYGYVVDGDKILPYSVKKRKIFKSVQLPCLPVGCKPEEELKFIDEAVKLISKEVNPDYIYTTATSIFDEYCTKSEYCRFGSYIISLDQTEDEIFGNLHSKHRNVVRKAEKDGLTVDFGPQYAEVCYDLIKDTYGRQGKAAFSREHFASLKSMSDHVDFWVVKNGEEFQGCAVLLWNKGFSSYYLHGGSAAHPHGGALNLLHWEAIKKMKARGVKYYDFVGARTNPEPGSKLEGIQRFKSRFGGEMKVGYMWRYVNNPLKYRLYTTAVKMYTKYVLKDNNYYDIIDEERAKGNY